MALCHAVSAVGRVGPKKTDPYAPLIAFVDTRRCRDWDQTAQSDGPTRRSCRGACSSTPMPTNHEDRAEATQDEPAQARVAEGTTPVRITRMHGRAIASK